MQINIKTPEGIKIEQEEIEAYIKHVRKNNPNREIEYLKITLDKLGYADLEYKLAPVDFERIRRITGYLVGTTDRWNNGKKAELKDRIKLLKDCRNTVFLYRKEKNMDTEVIVAAIAFIGTLVGSYFANSKTTAVMQEQIKSIKEEINTLSNRVDKHNNLVERMAKVEDSVKSAHHRITELSEGGK